jgi:hypothetical protein
MPQSTLPAWIQYAQAFALIIIPFVGAWIAWQQVTIARVKLQHDLYDRRFAVFQAARKLLAEVLGHGYASDDQIRSYVVGTGDAGFLLNDEISTYLEEIRKRATRLQAIKHTLEPLPVGDQRTALVQEDEKIFSWFMEQVPVLVEKFKPFLTLERHETLPRRLSSIRWRVIVFSRRNVIALGLLVTLVGSATAAKGVIISDGDAFMLMPSIPIGPTYEQAVRSNPVFQNLIYQSRTAMWGLILVAIGTAIQLGGIYMKGEQDV